MGQEEHQVYKKEPEGSYLDHSVIPEGTGRGLAMDFLGVIADTGSKNTLRAVLMDGCGVNLGWKIGMFVTIERELGCQLLPLSCRLNANEIDFREYFIQEDRGYESLVRWILVVH